jgi:hypothetical protein
MATHGRTGLSHLLIGSVAERVVRTAPCPVLTIRPPAEKAYAVEPVGVAQRTPSQPKLVSGRPSNRISPASFL